VKNSLGSRMSGGTDVTMKIRQRHGSTGYFQGKSKGEPGQHVRAYESRRAHLDAVDEQEHLTLPALKGEDSCFNRVGPHRRSYVPSTSIVRVRVPHGHVPDRLCPVLGCRTRYADDTTKTRFIPAFNNGAFSKV